MADTTNQMRVRAVTAGIEDKYGLPKGLLYKMAGQESNFTSDARSPKGASGWFQFMPETAAHYGITDPTNLEQSAEGAGRYMADNMKRYGDISHALADYNGGPKAVDALKAGKPWKETQGYLKGILGDSAQGQPQEAPPPLSSQFTTGRAEVTDPGPSASKLAGDAARADDVSHFGDLPQAAVEGFKLNNSVYNYWQTKSLEDMGPPSDLSDKETELLLEGIPPDYYDYILQGTSHQERTARKGRMLEAMSSAQKLGQMGWAGTVGSLGSAIVDLPTLAMFVPGLNEVGMVATGSRVANAVRAGVAWGTINAGYEAASYKDRPLGTTHDIYMAAAMGVGMGALTAGLHTPKAPLAAENKALRDFGIRETNKGHIQELKAAGLEIDPAYKAYLSRMDGAQAAALKDIHTGLRDWTLRDIDMHPRDTNVPVGHIDPPGVVSKVDPVAPKVEPVVPKVEPTGEAPKPNRDRVFEPSDLGDRQNLVLKGKTLPELIADMRSNSRNPELVRVLDRVLEGLNVAKIKFSIVRKGERHRDLEGTNFASRNARGMVSVPAGSTGDGLQMFLRDTSWGLGKHGMNEETLTHELVHAAAVAKQIAAKNPAGLKVDKAVQGAAQGIIDLHKTVIESAKSQFGAMWETELKNRLGTNLKNEYEMLAYGLTNRGFQEFLKTVKVGGATNKSMWDKFVTSVRGLLGIGEADHNALTKLLDLSGPLLDKGGLTRKSRAVLEAKGAWTSVDDVVAANNAELSPVFGWGLGLEHRLGSESVPAAVREFASKLFGTTVGYKDHSVVKANAWSMTTQLADGWSTKMRKEAYPAFESWFKESGQSRWQKGKAFDDFGAEVSDYIRGVDKEYPKQVKVAGDSVRNILADITEHINNPGKSSGGRTLGLTETLIKDAETGAESIIGTLEKNPFYLPRKHDISKWANFQNQFGREALEGWWQRAYQSGRPTIGDESAKKWAGWYVRTIEEAHVNRTQDLVGDMLQGMDRDGLKNSLVRNGGYTESEALQVLADMFPTKGTDVGALQASLKHRNTINEKYTEKLTTKDGQSIEVGLKDFTYSNAMDIVEPYIRRTAGSVSLAEHMGIYKASDIDKAILGATENKMGGEMLSPALNGKYRDDLRFAIDRVQGVPQEQTSKFNKSMEMWRSFNVIRLMGGTVWNQATELSQIAGSMGWKAMSEAMPELKSLTRDIATGKAPNDILDHLENTIGGAGSEFVKRMNFKLSDDWTRNWGDTAWNRRLDALDTKLKQTAKGTLDYTGMTPLMIQQKRIHAIALVNHFINDATGARVSTFLSKDRLSWMGLDAEGFTAVKKALKDYSSPTKGEYSMTSKLDFEKWVKEDPASHAKFMEAIHRESRRVIQENDLASMIPVMGTTLGQTMFQFMNFTLHGWNKSLMFAMNHKDYSTLSTVMHGGLLSSMAYMGRTMVNSMGMDAEQRQAYLDKRMSTKQIVANSIGRTAQASLLPTLYDSTLGNLTGPMFSGMRTTSDISSLASNPTLSAINSTLSLMKMGKNAISGDSQTTQSDIKTWGKLLPLNNVAPISTLLNSLANDYPTSSEQQ